MSGLWFACGQCGGEGRVVGPNGIDARCPCCKGTSRIPSEGDYPFMAIVPEKELIRLRAIDEGDSFASGTAVNDIYHQVHDVSPCDPDLDFPLEGIPDDGKIFCRVTGWSDPGDASVGLQSSGGWCLSDDQSDTTIETLCAERLAMRNTLLRIVALGDDWRANQTDSVWFERQRRETLAKIARECLDGAT